MVEATIRETAFSRSKEYAVVSRERHPAGYWLMLGFKALGAAVWTLGGLFVVWIWWREKAGP